MTDKTAAILAKDFGIKSAAILKHFFKLGTPVTLNQVLTEEQIKSVATAFKPVQKEKDVPVVTVKSSVQRGNSRTADKFVIRLLEHMRDRINELATKNHRSMNSQIISYIETMFAVEDAGFSADVDGVMKLLESFNNSEGSLVIAEEYRPTFVPHVGDPVRCKQYDGPWIYSHACVREGEVFAVLRRIDRGVLREETVDYSDLLPL